MKLSQNIDAIQFFKAVQACGGDVQFHSQQGDVLNLKSTLSQYLFTFLLAREDFLSSGQIICSREQDWIHLKKFVEEENKHE